MGLRIGNGVLGAVTGPLSGVSLLRTGSNALGTTTTGTGYRVIESKYAQSTLESGTFYQSGAAGRIGNDGTYINNTIEGAIKEFIYHKPNTPFTVFEVNYPITPSLNISSPPSNYINQPLSFTGDVNILTTPSLRAPGTTNLLIREGAVPIKIIKP
ncbi:hypothetical protein [Elusimicrobium minutum]|uniref:hypothetical protein n=1 Tax=Elusimicrobium minutum TaxID=423605 RepID=UPI000161824E|nr:hypothetical protein [Elusimicrobium minutum]